VPSFSELEIPASLVEAEEADEFIRFWIADGEDHVALRVGAMGDNEVSQWGMILADISVHIIRALRLDGSSKSAEEARAEIERAYLDRLKDKGASYSGSILGAKQ
jgi:hypothetical protein